MSSHFAVLGDNPNNAVFVKLVTESLEEEYEKAKSIYNISLESDLFIAAEPLSCCGDSNLLVSRRLPPFHDFGHLLGKCNQRLAGKSEILFKLFHKAGEILAELHASIHLATPHKTVLPDICRDASLNSNLFAELLSEGPVAHLHWDYGFGNLLIVNSKTDSPKLCVIDAAPQILKGVSIADKSSVYIDIGMFLSQVYLCAFPAYYFPTYKWNCDYSLSKIFLDGYEHRAGLKLNKYAAFRTALLIAELYSRLFFVDSDVRSIVKGAMVQRGIRRLSSVCSTINKSEKGS